MKRAFGSSDAAVEDTPPPARDAFEDRADDLEQYLLELTARLSADARKGRVPYGVPPPQLEHHLNGGSNPSVARYYADVLTSPALPPNARILDMGCGYGRIALELATRLTPTQQYVGLDPHLAAVDWAAGNITPRHPNFSFDQVDIASKVYNADGTLAGSTYRFPFEDESLDLVFMISVMTHVDIDTLTAYVHEAARTLAPTGRFVATFFLLDDDVDQLLASRKSTFSMRWPHGPSRVENPKNPELAIAHPRDLVLRILADAGFSAPMIAEGNWSGRTGTGAMDYQDLLIAPRSATAKVVPDAVLPDPAPVLTVDPAALHDAASCFERIGLHDAHSASELLTWANPVIINALWWQDRGFTLAVDHGERLEPFGFSFPACRVLGFDLQRPGRLEQTTQEPRTGVVPISFTPVSPHDLLDLLVDAGEAATPQAILDCTIEVAEHGMRIREALQRGDRLVLVAPGSSPRRAPITLDS